MYKKAKKDLIKLAKLKIFLFYPANAEFVKF